MSEAADFRARARAEADRYGPDPWIFVRELLQNARDAGATRVVFRVEEDEARTRVVCVDNGEGMSFEHARKYLFSLYASSKEGSRDQVGRFGVGFWSILRFDPSRIVVASREMGHPAWAVSFDGSLKNARHWAPQMRPGTRLVLERGPGDGNEGRRLRDAVWQNARFLRQRDDPEAALEIVVDGVRINAPFELPAPSARFRRGDLRGVVSLGDSPRVELFSRGLRIRAAASVDDLLSPSGHSSRSRVRFAELPGGLAPQALLESDALEPLLSRSDARDDRVLRRLVRLANEELALLVDRQLALARPPGPWERLIQVLERSRRLPVLVRVAMGAVAGALLSLALAALMWGPQALVGPRDMPAWWPLGADAWGLAGSPKARPRGGPYADLGDRYRGPQVSELETRVAAKAIALRYRPPEAQPHLAAMLVELDAEGRPLDGAASAPPPLGPCESSCVSFALEIDAAAGPLRLPIPTGHQLDPRSVQLDGGPAPALGELDGLPTIELDRPTQGSLAYTTGPAPARSISEARPGRGLPPELQSRAWRARELPRDVAVNAMIDLVRAQIAYSTARDVADRHRRARLRGEAFVSRSLAIGAGDCDVQNGVLVELLNEAGVPARLAVGYVGRGGRASPWLHAWAEWSDEAGRWRIADASEIAGVDPLAVARPGDSPLAAPADLMAAEGTPGPGSRPLDPEPPPSTGSQPPRGPTATAPFDAVPDAASPNGPPRLPRALGLAALAAGIFLLGWLRVRRRGVSSRELKLDEGRDLSRLLQGALQKPAAFARLPALFRRRLVPRVGGGALSLDELRALAAAGRLYRSHGEGQLGRDAARRGAPVIDTSTPEGLAVASTLGALDLDRWGELVAHGVADPLLEDCAEALRAGQHRWKLRLCSGLVEQIAWLDLHPLGLDREHDRLVFIDDRAPEYLAATATHVQAPARAVFELVERLAARMQIEGIEGARLLAPVAARMLHSETPPPPAPHAAREHASP